MCKEDINVYFMRENVNIRTFSFRSQSALVKELDSSYDAQYRDPEFDYIKADVKRSNRSACAL